MRGPHPLGKSVSGTSSSELMTEGPMRPAPRLCKDKQGLALVNMNHSQAFALSYNQSGGSDYSHLYRQVCSGHCMTSCLTFVASHKRQTCHRRAWPRCGAALQNVSLHSFGVTDFGDGCQTLMNIPRIIADIMTLSRCYQPAGDNLRSALLIRRFPSVGRSLTPRRPGVPCEELHNHGQT